MRCAKESNMTRLKCCACHEKWRWIRPKCCACQEKCTTNWKNHKNIAPATQKRFSTRYKTRLNVAKCHACHHAKRSNDTSEASKKDPSCRTSHRHGHTGIARTVADDCERLRTVANGATVNTTSSEHTLNPQTPQSDAGTRAMHSEKRQCNKFP